MKRVQADRRRIGTQFLVASLAAASSVGFMASELRADPPKIFSMFKSRKVAGDDLQLKDIHGPWLIFAMSFQGENAEAKAKDLALEIRKTLELPAYVHNKEFDYSRPLGQDKYTVDGRTFRVQPMNQKHSNTFTVLIGDFDSMDNPRVKEILQQVKYANPECLKASKGDADGDAKYEGTEVVSSYRRWIWGKTADDKRKSKGPMGAAFVTRNPLLPDEFFQNKNLVVDKFIEDMNREVEHSLLRAKGRFTVRVGTFTGNTTVTLGSKQVNTDGEEVDATNLEVAAARAHLLVEKLREQGVEAYEFHDRYSSMVTIGAFDSLGNTGPDGRFVYAPEIVDVMTKYGGVEKYEQTTAYGVQAVPKTIEKIPLDIEPKPIAIPRPATRSIYSGSLLGR